MSNNLKVVLDRLNQVLSDYAAITSNDRQDGQQVILTVFDSNVLTVPGSSTQFEFANTPTEIVDHVQAFRGVPLWNPEVDTEDDGRWRLFSVHIKEAVETADPDERILVIVPGSVAPRKTA